MIETIEKELLKEAKKAFNDGEVPVGCVIVYNDKIIAKAHNTKQKDCVCINHAEIKAILKAEKYIGDWRLNECDLYVTLYPCNMCLSVIKESRIRNVYYYLESKYYQNENAFVSINKIAENYEQFQLLLQNFFKSKR